MGLAFHTEVHIDELTEKYRELGYTPEEVAKNLSAILVDCIHTEQDPEKTYHKWMKAIKGSDYVHFANFDDKGSMAPRATLIHILHSVFGNGDPNGYENQWEGWQDRIK